VRKREELRPRKPTVEHPALGKLGSRKWRGGLIAADLEGSGTVPDFGVHLVTEVCEAGVAASVCPQERKTKEKAEKRSATTIMRKVCGIGRFGYKSREGAGKG
jgi:hypothetical protein